MTGESTAPSSNPLFGIAADGRPGWRKPLLIGIACRLARAPSARPSEWGTRMRRIKGGVHVQRRYKEKGWHPLPSVRKAWGLTAERPPD